MDKTKKVVIGTLGTLAVCGIGGTFLRRVITNEKSRKSLDEALNDFEMSRKRSELKTMGYNVDVLNDTYVTNLYKKVKSSEGVEMPDDLVASLSENNNIPEYVARNMVQADAVLLDIMLEACKDFENKVGASVDEVISWLVAYTGTPKTSLMTMPLDRLERMYLEELGI